MNIDQAREISITEILDRLGIHPTKTTTEKLLYLSPVRLEKTPSFYVYVKNNRWHDYGDGRGGDSIDFAQAFLKFTREADTISDALRWLRNMGMGPYVFRPVTHLPLPPSEPSLSLKKAGPIQHIGLKHYLTKRGIALTLAQRYLKEIQVRNERTGKSFYALGLINEEEGYELRNPFFKGTLGTKTITFIRGQISGSDEINIYEGFMDYLSTLAQSQSRAHRGDTIILNSLSCLKQLAPYMQGYGYRTACTWLDNDPAGHQATKALAEFFKTQAELTHRLMNHLYEPHKDVNAWHMHKLNLSL